MASRPGKIVAWGIWLISAAALVLWLILGGLSEFADGPVVALLFSTVILAYLIVGLLIATRQPRNPIGWLLLLGALCAALGGFTGAYAAYSQIVRELPGAAWAGWIANWAGTLGFGLWLYFIFLYFPNGKLVSPRWRLVVGLAVFTLLLGVLPAMFSPEYLEGLPGEADSMRFDWIGWNFIIRLHDVLLPIILIAGMVSIMLRFRHAPATERLQIKWVAYSAILGAVLTVMGVLGVLSGWASEMFFNLIFITFLFSIPITLGIAILRYRLWDIDFIIRRTLAYGFLTVFLSVIYLAMVTIFQQLAVSITGSAAESSIAIVITTLVVAAIFNPLRLRIQKGIDRRYYRNRYDPEAALNQLSSSIRDQVNVSQLCESLTATVSDTLHPETISIWVRKA